MKNVGRIKRFGGHGFGFIETIEGLDIYFHESEVMFGFSDDYSLEGKVVYFEKSEKYKRAEAVNVFLVNLEEEVNLDVLNSKFIMNYNKYAKPALKRIFSLVSEEDFMKLIRDRVHSYKNNHGLEYILSENMYSFVLSLKMTDVRADLSIIFRLKLYRKIENIDMFSNEIIACKAGASDVDWFDFCDDIKDKIDYGSILYLVAPDEVKNDICRKHYAEWIDAVRLCSQKPSHKISWEAGEIYQSLTKNDQLLAAEWIDKTANNRDYETAKMLSARGAEKASQRFYEGLGYQVEDIAIQQLSKKSTGEWAKFDLLVDNTYCVDVKNSRTPINKNNRYVEHCVPKFKETRDEKEVIIAGVLSSYLQLECFYNLGEIPHNNYIYFLGQTSLSLINNAINVFSNKNNKKHLKLSIDDVNYIPIWMFDYPASYYINRDEQRNKLRELSKSYTPTEKEYSSFSINPISAYLASGIELPQNWADGMKKWQVEFCEILLRLSKEKSVSMPYLFLVLLTHFLWMIKKMDIKEVEGYSPNGYRNLIYGNAVNKYQESIYGSFIGNKERMPLGIYDTLGVVNDFIDALDDLWSEKENIKLGEFESFQFKGRGLLTGQRRSDDTETILAYCGGFIENKGKCGYSPLIIGKDKTCKICGYLICPQCGCCQEGGKNYEGCLEGIKRMKKSCRTKV